MKQKTNLKTVGNPDPPWRGNRLKKPHWAGRRGFGTLEVVIIIAVLLTIALIFRHSLISFATRLISTVFDNDTVISDIALEDLN